jgi:translation initiation factor IF-2
MAEKKGTRLNKIAREFNIGIATIVEFLNKHGVEVDSNPNTKITADAYEMVVNEFSDDGNVKKESEKFSFDNLRKGKKTVSIDDVDTEQIENAEEETDENEEEPQAEAEDIVAEEPEIEKKELKVVGKIDLDQGKPAKKKAEVETPDENKEEEEETTEAKSEINKEEEVAETEPAEEDSAEKITGQTETVEKDEEVLEKEEISGQEEKQEEVPEIDAEEESETEAPVEDNEEVEPETPEEEKQGADNELKVVGKIDLDSINQRTRPPRKTAAEKKKEQEEKRKQQGKGKKQDYKNQSNRKKASVDENNLADKENKENTKGLGKQEVDDGEEDKKRKRKRIKKEKRLVDLEEEGTSGKKGKGKEKPKKKRPIKANRNEVDEEEVQQQIKETLAKLTSKSKSKGARYRREKRDAIQQKQQEELEKQEQEMHVIKVTEFISAAELATIMNVDVNEIISTCMGLGLFISINQRLDAETISLIAEAYNHEVEFTTADVQESIEEEEDKEEDLQLRPPIITVMGHVDHGKTKLLDHVRQTNIIAGESGGITQHIGAYNVTIENGREITFLDTPGHEAFTAMRARGAKVTDLAIIMIAADDGVKPQTEEAINHASAANIPMVFAINKIDKPTANPDKVKEQLSAMNYLVEDWGGKYQSQEISAKNGINVEDLLEKVLLETDILELKANPNRNANGTVLESSLDKGRGYVATVLVQNGTLRAGDMVLAGSNFGRVRAILNERNQRIEELPPAHPGVILGLNGAPQAGDTFHVLTDEKEAKDIATKRVQLQREQGIRSQKHITLEEIGRRIAIGNFQELNLIIKGDVDGSVEAISDSLVKLSTQEIQINIIHKGVGQISETDINLASASDAIIVAFKVRPSLQAKRIAEREKIDLRIYNVIYDAVEEIKAAMEGMLSPEIKEDITGNLEVLETFKISKTGTIAGCIVKDGKITRDSKVRLIRDGIEVYNGSLGSLKRFKNDAKEVTMGLECGLNIENFNDIKVGDVIEAYKEIEIERKLE